MANGPERIIREERVKNSIKDLEKDPISQKTMLRLEPSPVVTKDVDKGKGLVFDFEKQSLIRDQEKLKSQENKLLSSAIQAGRAMSRQPILDVMQSEDNADNFMSESRSSQSCSTVFRTGFYEASPFGITLRQKNPRRRPSKKKGNLKGKEVGLSTGSVIMKQGLETGELEKMNAK